MREKARSSFPPSSPSTRWVSLAKPVASWVPVSFSGLGTAYQREKRLYPVCTFSSYSLKGPGEVDQLRSPFPLRPQAGVLVPLTPQLCRVPDGLSQLTPDTAHPIRVRPAQLHWPESRGMDSLQKQDLRRPKIHGAVEVSRYQPPTLASLQRLLWVRRTTTLTHINEVWPNLFLGDAYAARDKSRLIHLGITHVVNVAAGRVLVHCAMGVSRSATVVLAFLMICENMTLVDAIQTVQAHRDICPNSGFLRQLQVLDSRLRRESGRL
ncbi:dual specificity protein phosphatase 13 isoform X2 [Phodopus roborovskii]|uniref:dual specificity protein phosphatase 13 isoform X2 n=1 Tax=Phodopus roborovskii TaxID=109678 RepID=UPI0021E50F90|nr:dual specificity protein phosphatase 13 isoform X2 [Phodopus roborovskii]